MPRAGVKGGNQELGSIEWIYSERSQCHVFCEGKVVIEATTDFTHRQEKSTSYKFANTSHFT